MVKTIIFVIYVANVCIAMTSNMPSMNKLKRYLDSEISLLEALGKHVCMQSNHLEKISSQLEPLSAVVSGRGFRDEYLSNPLNTLTLVRRLTTHWLGLINKMDNHKHMSEENRVWVKQIELEAVVRNLARIQETYNLSTNHLADSVLEESPAKDNLTGADCYWMALHYYQKYHYQEAVQWLDQALTKHDNTVPRHWLQELAVLSHCFLGDASRSSLTLSVLLEDFPKHKPSGALVWDWQFMTSKGCDNAKLIMTRRRFKAAPLSRYLTVEYNRLCQGNDKTSPDLKCRYVHYHKRHLQLAPFRLEELQLDPPVVIFHNVINDGEIREAQESVTNRLEKSEVLSQDGTSYEDLHRVSETAWIYSKTSKVLDNLTKRIKDMTNLDTQFAEPHQVTRYGVGGEYLFHGDYFGEMPGKNTGDRIATLMFYLNEVPRGGNTVFLNWELSVKPQKGSAVLWFNLKSDGSLDYSSIHAGCSVIKGTKWVLNKWFHELNNDITRPCHVDRKQTHKYFYL